MTFDGITTRAVVHELNQTIVGGHLKKINQVGPAQLTLAFYANGQNFLLYLSADSATGRFHLTEKKYQNPTTPPNFVMLLRKHLGQGKLLSITQEGLDRTVRFIFQTRDELGDLVEKHLVLEVMGRHSNLILLRQDGTVIEAIRRVSHEMSRVRQIYPGIAYHSFTADKFDVLSEDVDVSMLLNRLLDSQPDGGMEARRLFYGTLTGFSPLASTEIFVRADIDPRRPLGQLSRDEVARLDMVLKEWVRQLRENTFTPVLYASPKIQAYPFLLTHYAEPMKTDPSISLLIDEQTKETARDDRLGRGKERLLSILSKELEHQLRKLDHLEDDWEETQNRDVLKEEADLLAAYAHSIVRGQAEITVSDFFHDNAPRTIALDPRKSGHENMDARYRQFSKLNTAFHLLETKIPTLREEIRYLEQLKTTIDQAQTLDELEEIHSEFVREKLIRPTKHTKRKKTPTAKPYAFTTNNGLTVLVGRNNLQNDRLTLKVADKDDFFLHAKTVPGAHVILRTTGKVPTRSDIEAAAWLAARYSSRAEEDSVDIDYTEKKNVYKAKGAKPGMVYYNNYQTISVNTKATPALRSLFPNAESEESEV